MTDKIELHVGYIGKTRGGQRVEIVGYGITGVPFRGDNNVWYGQDGRTFSDNSLDIIGPWEEPAQADEPTTYNTSQWYGWNGGPCPVHPETVVDVIQNMCGQSNNVRAKYVDFELLHGSFRVVTPYVEPKPKLECWVNVHRGQVTGAFISKHAASVATVFTDVRCVRMIEADEQ